MGHLIYHCYDCGKTLVNYVSNAYMHPTVKGAYVCANCDLKYTELKDELYYEGLRNIFHELADELRKYTNGN